jgi:hypothetical protein
LPTQPSTGTSGAVATSQSGAAPEPARRKEAARPCGDKKVKVAMAVAVGVWALKGIF